MTVAPVAPLVLWAQRQDKVTLSIQLGDVKEETVNITEDNLTFTGKSDGKEYASTIEFLKKVNPEGSKYLVKGREVYCEVLKAEEEDWSRLCKDTKKRTDVKVDFSRWKDEDDSDDEERGGMGGNNQYSDASLEDMMKQMGTGGGMGGMGGFDPEEGYSDEDSDDENIPELEVEAGPTTTPAVNGDS